MLYPHHIPWVSEILALMIVLLHNVGICLCLIRDRYIQLLDVIIDRLLLPYERHKNGEEDELLTKPSSVKTESGKNENHGEDAKSVKGNPDSQENHKHKKVSLCPLSQC